MRFKDWCLFTEFDHVTFEAAQKLNGIQCDGIDMRFEDWQKEGKSATKFINNSFRGRCKEGWFVVNYHQNNMPRVSGSLGLALKSRPDIQVTQELNPESENVPELPEHWFHFAIMYLGNKVVKEPAYPRGDYERIKPSFSISNP